jgi:elongation factor Tu
MESGDSIRAVIHFASTAKGGRKTPIRSGYRPPFYFRSDPNTGYDGVVTLGVVTLEDRSQAMTGEECIAHVRFIHPELVWDLLEPNARFTIQEGARVVASGTVLQVLHSRQQIRP